MDDVSLTPPRARLSARALRHRWDLQIRGRMLALTASLVAVALVCVGVAVAGMLAARSKAQESRAAFNAAQEARDGYEGWLLADDQSNAYVAVAALGDPSAVMPGMTPRTTRAEFLNLTWSAAQGGSTAAGVALAWLARHAPEGQIRGEAVSARRALASYSQQAASVHAQVLAGNAIGAIHTITVTNGTISGTIQTDFLLMTQTLQTSAASTDSAIVTTVTRNLALVAIIGLTALLAALAISIAIVRSITRPLRGLTEAAQQLAAGDVGITVDIERDDEIGKMAAAFRGSVEHLRTMAGAAREIAAGNLGVAIEPKSEHDTLGQAFAEMQARVSGLLRQISTSSRTVGSASAQIARNGRQAGLAVGEIAHAIGAVAQGAEIQVRSLAQAREVTEEVASASQSSATEARQTANAAREARAVAAAGAAAVTHATEVIRGVAATNNEITRTMGELDETSQAIGGILDTIKAVTKQTNLLALNAAIEAARAGEQGRGFAVVAEHVRELAEQSQQAAATIGEMIAQMQGATSSAVAAVSDGARQTEEGVATVEQAREAFLRIDSSVEDMTARVTRIADSIEQIASSGSRVAESVDEVIAVAEQSSASAQEATASAENTSASTQQIAASAQTLAETAHELEQLVSHFSFA